MAYDSEAENIALLKRSLLGTFDFSGRSRRTEVVYFFIATALLNGALGFAVSSFLPWKAAQVTNWIIEIVLGLPLFALFARRLHDQNRTGWWTLILPIVFGLNVIKSFRLVTLSPDEFMTTPNPLAPYDLWIGLPLVIAYLVLAFIPGTVGENKFGSDPRAG
jgi:uncharacterized membrane protein YhaH (DUF805 family)